MAPWTILWTRSFLTIPTRSALSVSRLMGRNLWLLNICTIHIVSVYRRRVKCLRLSIHPKYLSKLICIIWLSVRHVWCPVSPLFVYLSVSLRVPVCFYPVPLFIRCWRIELLHAYRPAHSLCSIHWSIPCSPFLLLLVLWNQSVFPEGREWSVDHRVRAWATAISALRKRDYLGLHVLLLTDELAFSVVRCWDPVHMVCLMLSCLSWPDHIHWLGVLPPAIWLFAPQQRAGWWIVTFVLGFYLCFYLSLVFIMKCYFSPLPPFAAIVGRTLLDVPSCEWTARIFSVSYLILYTLSICYGVHLALR